MPKKSDMITELYKSTLKKIVRSNVTWCEFLRSAAYQYKYSFSDRVLIYAQKPEAIACAPLEIWNRHFGLWINRGAKGIALIREKNGRINLSHVFDVKDTHSSKDATPFSLWQIEPAAEDKVITALENRFGTIENKSNLPGATICAVKNICEDNTGDYLNDLMLSTAGSFLDSYDKDNLSIRLGRLLKNSVAYTVLSRLGYDPALYVDAEDLRDVWEFDTPATANLLGTATGDLSEICLREIEKTVRAYEKNTAHTFDKSIKNVYNKAKINESRGMGYGIQNEKRAELSESDTPADDRTAAREIRYDEIGLSEETPQGNVYHPVDRGETHRAPARNRADGENDAFAPCEADGRESWGERADESGESDALGAGNEQHQNVGGGDSSERSDLRISEKQPRKYLDNDDLIKILKHGDELAHSKQDIMLFLSQETNEERKNQYIRECYKPMTVSIYKDEAGTEYIGYSSLSDDGLYLFEGTFINPKAEMSFSWQMTRKLIEALIKDNNYLDTPIPKTLAAAPTEIAAKESEPKAEVNTEVITPVRQNFAVSQEVVDAFLRLGGCTKESNYRIYGFYRRANNSEETIKFLRAEYENDAVGLIVNGQKAAAMWDESGVTFAQGENVNEAWRKSTLTWAEIEKRLRELIELGQYLPQGETEKAVAAYNHYVASRAAGRWWDGMQNASIPYISEKTSGYPSVVQAFEAVLDDSEKTVAVADSFSKVIKEIPDRHFYRYGYGSEFVSMLLQTFKRDPVEYPQIDVVKEPMHFLSGDQIDNFLISRGSGISDGKMRIYSFFLREKDNVVRAKFLSDEYGIGGSADDRHNDNHDSKGLALSGGLDSYGKFSVLLKWKQVADRIDTLIRMDRYLTAKEVEHLDAYEKEQIARRIVNFYYGKSAEAPCPFEKKDEAYFGSAAEKEVYQQLGDARRVNEIVGMMQTVFDSEMPGSRTYDHDRKCLADVRRFAEGKYNLFPGSKYRKKEQVTEAPRVIQPIETGREESPLDIDFTQYGLNLKLGDWLHIGQNEVQLSSATADGVELYDGTLFPMEMTLEVFVRRVKENPLNEAFLLKDSEKVVNEPMPAPVAPDEPEQADRHEIAAYALGDFYEFFDEDATRTAEICDLIMTTRMMTDGTRHPMCGIPKYAADSYEQKLKKAGYTVVFRDFNEFNADRQATPEPDKDIPTEEHIFLDSTREELYWIYYNPDSDAGGQLVTNTLSFSVFKETYEDFVGNGGDFMDKVQRYAFIDSISEMADCELADARTPFFTEAMATFDTEPDYTGFTAENLSKINREIEGFMVDMEAERAGDAYEAEYGADGYRMFPGNAPEADSEETAMPTLQEEKPKPKKAITTFHPEIPLDEKHDFRITDNDLGVGGAKEKYRRNIAAIRLLHTLENADRIATPEEQQILSEYTGWGGLPDAFDENKDSWAQEYRELSELLTPAEYAAARESTLTAFYTPPVVIKAIYKALENTGFARGNILEPSCGVGNFMGLVPESMSESRFYGVELDSISGRIAQQLYQKQNISVTGFENTAYPDSFFDVAIGNVPFGQFKVQDKRYDRNNFLIHDYFFAKALDQVRPGGVIAFITSKGTLDKQNPSVRRYIAARADFLGAIRLPDTTFKASAGTEAVADIIFLQKRDRMIECDPDWCHLGKDENGIETNQYFVEYPDMVLGSMVTESGPFGPQTTCKPFADVEISELLPKAVSNIHAEINNMDQEELTGNDTVSEALPADPSVRNFSYALISGRLCYRRNSIMNPVKTSLTGENRIKGMIALRDTVHELIDAQLENYPDSAIKALQHKLNIQYDHFTSKYGLISSRANESAFSDDSDYFLLCSLEILDDEDKTKLKRKADIFSKRTINPVIRIDHADTASEALAVSLSEHAFVDIPYMCELTGKTEKQITDDLKGVIYRNHEYTNGIDGKREYLTADEYLSGNVRQKLRDVEKMAETESHVYSLNVKALKDAQPADLTASEIGVRLGATWIPPEYIQKFIFELLDTPRWMSDHIQVKYISLTSQWAITEKNIDRSNVKAGSVFGTPRVNAYHIIEDTLNLKTVQVFDYVDDGNGGKKAVLNKNDTMIAQGKQEEIKRAFEEWIWNDPDRRDKLCRLYNEKFNSIRPREYDGSHIRFFGMTPAISLRKHQKDAVARIIYGGNTLLAHVVGGGKTFTMVAAAQESKRLGLCSKSMFVVPNHLIEQWASEYLQLYPAANILVAAKKDFETRNRKKFCARIATGDYDAVIIGHSQFEKIPLSPERQATALQDEIDNIITSMDELKRKRGERVTIKQLARAQKQLETRLAKLNDQSRKDGVVYFEELGVDRIFVDEAHYFKNLFLYTKMRNVAGIAQSEAQKSSDLYMKCRYLDELTGGRGVVFATGTPISNSMTELYTMQRYLQYDILRERGLESFDAWASTFGETVAAIELAPDGRGYRPKTRFARFFNIPELMSMFREAADIRTADMLDLPVPKAKYRVVKVAATETQEQMVQSFAKRAEKIHSGIVKSYVDNMLLVTNDGRKAALDQRLLNPMLPDEAGTKVNTCIGEVCRIWEETKEKHSAQLIFCDLSTPKGDGQFNVYDDIRVKLIAKGIPPDEIAFIHTADTDAKKKELFSKVRAGQVRILLGSTLKMGAGTNVQTRLIASHDLDCPWRPADLEQRAGRIVRQGNTNPEVEIIRYVTQGTFDAYSYQLLESKQRFISQIMTSKSPVRVAEDIDDASMSYAEIKAIASGNPEVIEKMQLDADVMKLKLQKAAHLSQRYSLEDKLRKEYPSQLAEYEEKISGLSADMRTVSENTFPNENGFSPMTVMGYVYDKKTEAGKAILEMCQHITAPEPRPLGRYRGLDMTIAFDTMNGEFVVILLGKISHKVLLGRDANGIITRIDNAIDDISVHIEAGTNNLSALKQQIQNAKDEIKKPFVRENELAEKLKRLDMLNAKLNLDKKENEFVDCEHEQENTDDMFVAASERNEINER